MVAPKAVSWDVEMAAPLARLQAGAWVEKKAASRAERKAAATGFL